MFLKTILSLGLQLLVVATLLIVAAEQANAACVQDSDCQNGGTCDASFTGLLLDEDHMDALQQDPICLCQPGFWGDNCQETCPLLCENGGQCEVQDEQEEDNHGGLDIATTLVCGCPTGFEGPLCSQTSGQEQQTQPPVSSLSGQSRDGIKLGAALSIVVVLSVIVATIFTWKKKRAADASKSKTAALADSEKNGTDDPESLSPSPLPPADDETGSTSSKQHTID